MNNLLSRQEIIDKLSDLPNLPVVFLGKGPFGLVRQIERMFIRTDGQGNISIMVNQTSIKEYYNKQDKINWTNAKEIEVIAIMGD